MEEFESMNQSLAEIFETQSPLAKERDKLEKQVQEAKPILNELKEGNFDLLKNFLKIFYKEKELKKQIKRLEKLNDIQILTSCYSILAFRLDRIDKIKDEIQEITET